MAQNTAPQYRAGYSDGSGPAHVTIADSAICVTTWGSFSHNPSAQEIAQAEEIAHKLNCHADLVEALECAEQWLEKWASAEPQLRVVRAALARAASDA